MRSQVWQIGAGSSGRFYADIFFAYDVMFIGPGRFGEYERQKYVTSGWPVKTALDALERFYRAVQPGDLVIALPAKKKVRGGTSRIHADTAGPFHCAK